MKKVYMEAIIRPIGLEIKDKEDVSAIDFGGYNFRINGKNIPFDFEGYGADIEEDEKGKYVRMCTAWSSLFKVYDIDGETYKEEYASLGISSDDITAEFLASASHINEFYFLIELKDSNKVIDAIIEDVVFIDENSKEYHMNKNLFKMSLAEINNQPYPVPESAAVEEKKLIKPITRIKPEDPMPTGMPPKTTEEQRKYFILMESKIDTAEPDRVWTSFTGKDDVIKFLTHDALNLIKLKMYDCYVGSEEDPIVNAKEFIKTHGRKGDK